MNESGMPSSGGAASGAEVGEEAAMAAVGVSAASLLELVELVELAADGRRMRRAEGDGCAGPNAGSGGLCWRCEGDLPRWQLSAVVGQGDGVGGEGESSSSAS